MPNERLVAVIDDDASLRRAIVALVRSMGHEANGYPTAEAFLAAEDRLQMSCIITDIQMPGMSGIDLKELLDREGSRIPVIMITARLEDALLERALASGPVGLLRKPFEPNAFFECLETALGTGDN